MEITFPINKLLALGLSADDYSIAILIKEEKYGLLNKLAKITKGAFLDSLSRLKTNNYIDYPSVKGTIPIKEAKTTTKFRDILLKGDNFEELYNNYPIKALRVSGKEDYLRINKTKCKVKYKKIIKNNQLAHEHILDCLKFEVEQRQSKSNMAYMKRMESWLDNEEWKRTYEYKLKLMETLETNKRKGSVSYGTTIL